MQATASQDQQTVDPCPTDPLASPSASHPATLRPAAGAANAARRKQKPPPTASLQDQADRADLPGEQTDWEVLLNAPLTASRLSSSSAGSVSTEGTKASAVWERNAVESGRRSMSTPASGGWKKMKGIAKAGGGVPMPGTRGRFALLLPAGPAGMLPDEIGVKSPRYAHLSYDNAGASYCLRDFLTGQELRQDDGPPAASIWEAALDRIKLVGEKLHVSVEDATFWHHELARRTDEYHRSSAGDP
jgi:hypothetical protein